jgi:hypothetical protein
MSQLEEVTILLESYSRAILAITTKLRSKLTLLTF